VNKIKSYSIVALSIIMTIAMVMMPMSSYAVDISVNGGELETKLEEAAELQVIANAMKFCVKHIRDSDGNPNPPFLTSSNVKAGKIFDSSLAIGDWTISGTDIATGMWLENKVQGNGGDNGTIWCTNNDGKIIKLFARAVGVDYMQGVICQKNGDGWGGGLFTAFSSAGGTTDYDCLNAIGYHKKSDENMLNYLKGLYDAYRTSSGNEYMVEWDKLGDFTGERGRAVGYWLYHNDFNTFCTALKDKETTIKTVSRNYSGRTWAKIKNETVKVRSNWKSKTFTNFVGDDSFTCGTLKERIDNYAKDYAKMLVDYLAPRCKTALSPVISAKLDEYQAILDAGSNEDGEEYTDESLQAAQAYIDKWKNYQKASDDSFIEKTDEGGYICNTEAEASVNFTVVAPSTTGDAYDSTDICYGNSGSLGWIVCPVITWLGDTLNTMYTEMVEPFLVVNSELVSATNSSGEESATHRVWEIFRNFANGAFIILFLVVIFSQLTGVGIDNYGIKKILPKLIVAAILINLSYVICQLAVDVSNIAGSGLNSMFTGIANEVPMTFNGDFNSGTWFAGLLNGLLVVLGIGAGAALVGAAVESGLLAGIILPLLMGLLVAFIAVIFFFALLGLRKAGVVVLVAISPLAFACYMLPNTKKLFDKWLKVFEGLLLLYPICGLLIGGSVLTSRMLVGANEGDFLVYLIGLLLMVVPFFFVPVLLKGSFAAMGNIGAKISSLGNRFGRGLAGRADKGIRNSETFRRMDNAMGRHSVFKRRRAAAVAGTAAMMKERSNRDRLGDRRNMQTRISAIAAAEEAKATDEQTAQRLSLMMSSGSQGGIVMRNGTRTAYTLSNLEARMKELRTDAEGRALTASEQVELSALARGMAGMKGGAGKIGKIIRGAEVTDPTTGAKSVNSNFMAAMGEIYTRDATVQNKLGEKDVGASVFTEQFMPGGKGLKSPAAIGTFAAYQGTTDYQNALNGRIKSYEVGLNQGGDAVDDYIATLTAADCQTIMDNETLFNSLDTDVRQKFVTHAGTFGVTGRSARAVTGTVTVGNPVLNVQGSVDANVTNPVLDVQGTVNVGNEVDVNIRQSRGGQVQPVQTQPQILPRRKK